MDQHTKPDEVWNNLGYEPRLGTPTRPSTPATSTIFDRQAEGLPRPLTIAF